MTILVTGAPDALAVAVAAALLTSYPDARASLLVPPGFLSVQHPGPPAALRRFGDRVRLVPGEITQRDVGLDSRALGELRDEVHTVVHAASGYHLGVDKRRTEELNIDATRRVLEFCGALPRLRRLHHVSTAWVCGDRSGVILEDELETGQHFQNTWQRTRFVAELEVRRQMNRIPTTIHRPSLVVGDRHSGALGRMAGPSFFVSLCMREPARVLAHCDDPRTMPLHIAPIDYVAEAIAAADGVAWTQGRTLHLTDPNPLTVGDAVRLIQERSNAADRGGLLARVDEMLLRMPVFRRPRRDDQLLDELNAPLLFNAMHATRLACETGRHCPSLPEYVDALVDGVREEPVEKSSRGARRTGAYATV